VYDRIRVVRGPVCFSHMLFIGHDK
jgi:hypothetical protein